MKDKKEKPKEIVRKKPTSWIDLLLKIVPKDPVMQSGYIYGLSWIVFIGLLGFSVSTFVEVFRQFSFSLLFRGIFMAAITLLSLAGLRSTKQSYEMTRDMYSGKEEVKQELQIESVDEMMKEFTEK